MRETLAATHHHIKEGRAIVVFPAGGIARGSATGLKELDWLPTVVKLMRRFDVPILPLHVSGRNSFLYYLFEQIHHELRDLLRFREVLQKAGQKFDIRIGNVIKASDIDGRSEDVTKQLQRYVLNGCKGNYAGA